VIFTHINCTTVRIGQFSKNNYCQNSLDDFDCGIMSVHGGYEDQPILAELYDLVPGYRKRADRDFYLDCCRATEGSILELGCGSGRILLPIAEAGCHITGIDISEHMLAQCRRKLQLLPAQVQDRVHLVQGDIAAFELNSTFQSAIIPFRVFAHLIDVEDQLSCLRRVNRHLSLLGSRLTLDIFQVNLGYINNPRSLEEREDFPEFELPDGRRLRRSGRLAAFHRAEQYNDVAMIYYLTGVDGTTERIVQTFPFRYFFRYEMEHLLDRCGFRVVELFGDFDKSPLVDDSPEMIFVAEKCRELS
jgi:SAM-dependent methyltransferase